MNLRGKIVRGSVIIFYLLIGLEIIIMISPFAAYFYAGYGPLLNVLYAFPATAWLTGFFLPHAVMSKSETLNFINSFGRTLFSLGIIAFLVGAFQIYTAKIRRKGVVTGMLYRWIRHPQYLFLAIAGLGLLLFWPRFFILIMYVSMLFVYYLLARHEEQRMLAKHGESYRTYMERTAMFLPGNPGGKIFRLLFGWSRSQRLSLGLAYLVTLVLFIGVAFALRSYTISKTSMIKIPEKQLIAVSITPQSDGSIKNIVDIAYQDNQLSASIENYHKQGHKGFMVHIMPMNYMMQGLFTQPNISGSHRRPRRSFRAVISFIFPLFGRRHHQERMGSMSDGPMRLIFSQLNWPNGGYAAAEEALAFRVKNLPLLRVDVDTRQRQVLKVDRTAPRNYWGQMPMPAF
ncbi:MAG: isoprenylcysteine carboxylmethyltransferase family protein [Desulfobacterales bacterium]|nr:MAG: isoprenylcysteine carboxylmethyltransferase family protein [Desulfobacterales bacterium]